MMKKILDNNLGDGWKPKMVLALGATYIHKDGHYIRAYFDQKTNKYVYWFVFIGKKHNTFVERTLNAIESRAFLVNLLIDDYETTVPDEIETTTIDEILSEDGVNMIELADDITKNVETHNDTPSNIISGDNIVIESTSVLNVKSGYEMITPSKKSTSRSLFGN